MQISSDELSIGPGTAAALKPLLEAAPDAIALLDAGGVVVEWNARAEAVLGWIRAEALGRSLAALVVPAGGAEGERLRRLLAEERSAAAAQAEIAAVHRDGRRLTLALSLARLRGGGAAGLAVFMRDVTEQRRAEEALRRSELLYRSLVAAAAAVVWTADGRGAFVEPQASWQAFTGQPWEAHRGFGWIKAYHPEDRPRLGQGWNEAMEGRAPYAFEGRLWHEPTRQYRYVMERGVPLLDVDGAIDGWAGTVMDVHERRRAEEAYKEESRTLEILHRVGTALVSELNLGALVQSATDAARELCGAEMGAFLSEAAMGPADGEALFALSGEPEALADGFPLLQLPGLVGLTFAEKVVVRSADIGRDPRYAARLPGLADPAEAPPLRSYLAVPVVSRSGEVLGGLFFGHRRPDVFTGRAERIVGGIAAQAAVAIDNARLYQAAQREIAHRARVEEHQKLLLAELNHRVKNTLAVVLAIATQTLRSSTSLEAFDRAFQGRLRTLARAHTLLTDRNWQATDLAALVREAFAPYPTGDGGRVRIDGPPVLLRPRAALTLSLVLHELTTNALKHGALSSPGGRLSVGWAIDEGGGRVRFD
ncbi:MAG: PAS domain S-box protein, partial [Rhodospirillaceae bacterium]|nr:PAS domain S-box protein [Rhodospirillaceae bacterium]